MATRKILIIDDSKEILEMVKMIVEHRGFKAVTLSTAKNALEVSRKENPDLILLDISMPDKDGYQVCDEIRCDSSLKHIPIIVFTAMPQEKDMIKDAHRTYGATDFLVKPFEPDQLLEKIKKYISSK